MKQNKDILRIAVFYDGGYVYHISNYYRYIDAHKRRLSLPGLHAFIRERIAKLAEVDEAFVKITESHYFIGRFPAQQAAAKDKLLAERIFEDVLIAEGVQLHYWPYRGDSNEGVLPLAFEAIDRARLGEIDLACIITGNGELLPLVTKLASMNVKTFALGWKLDWVEGGSPRKTSFSSKLLDAATWSAEMQNEMSEELFAPGDEEQPKSEEKSAAAAETHVAKEPARVAEPCEKSAAEKKPSIFPIFRTLVRRTDDLEPHAEFTIPKPKPPTPSDSSDKLRGVICSLKEGFGFIRCQEYPNNVFFHFSAVVNCSFDDLRDDDPVAFKIEMRERGPVATYVELMA